MKAKKHEIQTISMGDWELHRALETVKARSADESVAVEFGTVDNMDDNQLRYNYNSLSYTHLNRTQYILHR